MIEFKKNNIDFFSWTISLPIMIGTAGISANEIDYDDELLNIKKQEIIQLSNYINIEPVKIIMLSQAHGDSIIIIDKTPKEQTAFPEADGIITAINELCLVIRTADCVPVFAYDTEKKVIGAVHSGWRGCRQNIAGKLIRKMKYVYKSNSEQINIFILPSIGPSRYKVNLDVAEFFHEDIITRNGNMYLNMWQNIERSLLQEGILKQNIYNAGICTYLNNQFFSYRRGDLGRNINFGFIKNTSKCCDI